MTRKDYVLIAAALRQAFENCADMPQAHTAVRFTAGMVCNALANDNQRFDRERFLTSCGVQP